MKKLYLFILTVLMVLCSMQLSAQQTVTIGTGTGTAYYTPFNSLWGYSFVEAIYTASEISSAGGAPGTITSISFQKSSGTGQTNNIVLYMKNVSRTSFSSNSDWETVTASDIVYSGTWTIPTSGWTTITLDVPFVYDGTNLLVAMHENTSGYTTQYFYYTSATNSIISFHSDTSDPDPYNLGSWTGTIYTQSNRSNIQLELTAGDITCHSTGVLSVSGITSTDATISWAASVDPGTQILQYKTSNETWDSPGVITEYPNDTTFDFSGTLSPMTTYDVRVAVVCSPSDTSFWRSTSFTTACAEITSLPYIEGFDTYGTGETAYPDCWAKINTYSANRPYVNSTHYEGVGSLYFYAGTSGTYNIAIAPPFDSSIPINTLQAEFMYRAYYNTDRLIVGVMEDPTDATTFVPVDTIYPGTGVTTWEERAVSFANYTGTGQYIAFWNNYTSQAGYGYMDNLSIGLIPSCVKPQYVTLSNYTTEGCDVSWTPAGSESSWEVVAVPANTSVENGTPEPATAIPYTLTGLIDDTEYDVYVRAACGGGDYSVWSYKATFTTDPLCTSPQNVAVSQVSGTSALVTWESALYGATGYSVGYSEADQENWVIQSVTGNSYMIPGLTPNTDYDVFVLSECDEGDADTVFSSFTTNCMAGGDPFVDGSTNTYTLPLNNYYNYSYTQQIFLASEINGATTIDSIAFYYNYTSPSTDKTNVTLYLGHTTQSTFSSSSNYIPATNLQQVYSGHMNCQQGWNTFVFTTPFQYNGIDNLVVVVDDNSGDYNGSSYVFRAHNAGATRSLYFYSDSYNPNPSNPTSAGASSSTSSNRSDVKFFIPCDNTVTCMAPNVYVSDATNESLTVDWAPGYTENSWEMEYCSDTANWISVGVVNTHPYEISNLASDTKYWIRLRSNCGAGQTSGWAMIEGRTACDAVGIPYTEDFDDAPASGSGNMVTCWTTGSNYTTTHYPYTSSTQHYSGNYSAYFYGTSAYYSYMASPVFEEGVDMANLQVRFFAYKTTASYYIQVGIMTDPNDPGTFVQVGQNLTPSTISTWEMMEVNTDSYTGTGRYIAFRIPAVSTSYMYVDDITVDIIPVCLHVENVHATATTTTTADIAWTAGGDETDWMVVYGLAGTITDPEEETYVMASGTPEISLTDLSPSASYDVFVKAVCSSSESSIWWHGSFNTACGEINSLPFTENFDNMGTGTGVFPNCWYRYNTYSTSTSYPYVSNSYHASGNASLYFYSSSSTYNIAILPPVDVTVYPVNTLQVSFKMRSTSSVTSVIQVGVMSDSVNVNSFVPVETVHNTATGIFETFDVPLTNYTGTGNYIALKLVNSSSTYSIYMDDLVVELAPLCSKPTNVIASNITASGADINWIPGGDETSWEVVVVPAGASVTTGTAEQATEHPYTISNLNNNTAYDVYVRADCGTGEDFSSWSQVCSFTTPPLCSAPTDVTVSQVAGTSALVTWTPAIFGATSYTVSYTETGMDSWTTQSVIGDNYMLTGLTPETAYTLTIASECAEGTAPVVTKTFTTSCLYGGDLQIGNGTITNYYIPVNNYYHYTYSEQIFLASEMGGAGELNSISFDYAYSSSMTDKTSVNIYLKHTTQSSFSSSSDYVDTTGAQLVYQGNLNCHQGWNTFNFTTPFQYNGTDNLVLIVDDNSDDYNGSSYTFHVHDAGATRTLYYYSDSYDPQPGNLSSFSGTKTTSSNRSNVIFGTECDYTVTCIAPNVYVSGATENSITLNWAPGNGESSWELEYSTDDSTWVSQGTVTSAPYTISNLTPSTLYVFRMRSVCGGGEYSNWTTVSQRTECAPITTLPFMENFDSYAGATTTSVAVNNLPYCWSFFNEGTNTSYSGYPIIYTSATYAASGNNSMRFYTYTTSGTYDDQVAILPAIDVNVLPMNTLQLSFDARNNSSYTFTLEIGVMSDPANMATFVPISSIVTTSNTYANYEIPLNQYTGTGAYIALKAPQPTSSYNAGYVDNVVVELIPTCPKPTQLHVVNATESSVEIGWTENGSATSWVVEYGPVGFTPGNGTEVNASTNPYSVGNLNASTQYDFYVRANCDGGDFSNYSSVLTAATECAPIDQLPYVENFDAVSGAATSTSVSTNNLPICWNYLNQGTSSSYSGYPIVYSSSTYAASGTNTVRFYSYTTSGTYDDQIAILPPIDPVAYPINTLQLSFDARNNSSYTFTLVIGIMSNPADKTTFVPIDTIVTTSNTYASYEIPFSLYTGTGNYIAMMAPQPTSSYNAGYVDNVMVDLIPTCPKPHDLTIVNTTVSSVELGWTEMGSATTWEIAYGAPGFDPDGNDATYVTANANPFTVQNLNNSTTYDFYVRALCSSSDISYWSNKISASTTMVPVDLPYTADFTDATDAWVLNNGNCTNYWVKGTVDNEGALFVTDNGTTPNYTITSTSVVAAQKLFTVGTADSVTITFDVQVDGESSFDYMKLFLAPASMQFPASTTAPSSGDYGYNNYSTYAYDFYSNGYGTQSSYHYILNKLTGTVHVVATMPNPNATPTSTSTALLAFVWKNDPSVGYQPPATITNLTVTAEGSGPVITNPTVATTAATAITQTTATLNGTVTNPDNVTITAKGFEWKATAGGTYTPVNVTGNNLTYNLTGLTANTGYTYKAFITYNGTTVYGSEMTFTTLPGDVEPCSVPTGLHTMNIAGEAIAIAWDANANVNNWNIQYRPQNGTWSSASSTTNSYTITGLTGNTTYEIQVQANCGDGNLSDWSASITATTTGIDNYLSNSILLYPNPAKDIVNVQSSKFKVQSVEVVDVYGKVINTMNVTENPTRINVSNLVSGVYFVRVTTEEGVVTKQFVKR